MGISDPDIKTKCSDLDGSTNRETRLAALEKARSSFATLPDLQAKTQDSKHQRAQLR